MIRVRQIKVDIDRNNIEEIKEKVSKKLHITKEEIKDLKIIKESIDARDKSNIKYVYEVQFNSSNEEIIIKRNKQNDVFKYEETEYKVKITGTKDLVNDIVVVGSGPAGLFCAYELSKNGYNVTVIERGKNIDDRTIDVEEFWNAGKLNTNSNVQFGEGGAGTFSDGKLNTLVNDKNNRMKEVFNVFVKNGAPSEILYKNKPHIGTDILKNVVKNIRNEIINNGGTFRFETCLTNLIIKDSKLEGIEVNNSEIIKCNSLVLAIGHSARDTFEMLHNNKLEMTSKPFAVGIRIQHPQNMINKSQYGVEESEFLPPADYKLTYRTKDGRGVYSFCMCPGGYVVNASSEEGRLVVNGMSNNKRDSKNANSAIVVQVSKKDFGNNLFDGVKFQQELESKAYKYGNKNIPVQLYKDFKNNKISNEFKTIKPIFKGNYNFSNINNILPNYINESLIEAIEYFNTKIKGFNHDDAILSAVESRTSSPIKILRNENLESNIEGIFPCGEGAGYAGGITTSAMDGLKVSEKLMSIYKKANRQKM